MAAWTASSLKLALGRYRRPLVGTAVLGILVILLLSAAGNGPLHAASAVSRAQPPAAAPAEINGGNQCHCYGNVSDAVSGVPRYYDPGSAGCAAYLGVDPSDPGACQVWVSLTVVEAYADCNGAEWDVYQVEAGVPAGHGNNSFEVVDTCQGPDQVSFDDYDCQALLMDGCPNGPSGSDGAPASYLGAAFYGPAPAWYDPNPYVVTANFVEVPLGDCQGTTTGWGGIVDPIVLEFSNCASYYSDQPGQPSDDNDSGNDSDNGTGDDWNETGWEPCEEDNSDCEDLDAGNLTISTGPAFGGGTACSDCAASWVATLPITYADENDTVVYLQPGTYHWATTHADQGASPSGGVLTVLRGTPQVLDQTLLEEQTLTFTESGLPAATNWTVGLAGTSFVSSGTNLVVHEANGTYPYLVWGVPGYAGTVSSSTGKGTSFGVIDMNGDSHADIVFTKAATGSLVFSEKGLAKGTSRCILLGASSAGPASEACGSSHTLVFSGLPVPNASGTDYTYSVVGPTGTSSSPPSQVVSIDAHTKRITPGYSAPTYNVTIQESGLPSGTKWHVAVAPCHGCEDLPIPQKSAAASGPGTSLTVSLLNGTYNWTVGKIAGYAMFFGNGTGWSRVMTVNGASETLVVKFLPEVYNVTFTESGLPPGTNWSVSIGGATDYSTSSTIVVLLANGTYKYTLGAVAGYVGQGSPTTVKVHAKPVGVTVTFKPSGGGGSGFPAPLLALLRGW